MASTLAPTLAFQARTNHTQTQRKFAIKINTALGFPKSSSQIRYIALSRLTVTATKNNSSNDNKPENTSTSRMKEVEKTLQSLGIDSSTAKRVREIWRQAGATDAAGLRRLLLKRSVNRGATITLQLVLDVFAASISFYTARQVAEGRPFGAFNLAIQYSILIGACYLGISCVLDLFALVALTVATARYSANSAAFLEAVERLAGPDSGLQVLDKAKKAIVTIKVLSALEQILQTLKDGATGTADADFFRDLGAYLQLNRALEKGFDWESIGISADKAADIAAEFDRVDQNGDGKLDEYEFTQLCKVTAPELDEAEIKAAISVLDKNGNGTVDLEEFFNWWTSEKVAQPAKE